VRSDGAVERSFPLDRSDLVTFGGQPAEDKILATFGENQGGGFGDLDVIEIDLATGAQRLVAEDRAVMATWYWTGGDRIGTPAAEVFMADGALVRHDLTTGRETVIAGRLKKR
jgi:hypothetical protein